MLGFGVRRGLQRAWHAVEWVQDGEEAAALAAEPYDVVLLDLGLPRKSGLDVLRTLRQRGTKVPVVILLESLVARTGDHVALLVQRGEVRIFVPVDLG
jgi:DNA-binding response OmpR family regulator